MKSHVSIEQKKCPVCAKDFDTGAVLLDKRLRPSMERTTLTGWGFCPDCTKKTDEGYIALVGVDESKSDKRPDGNADPDQVWRTGDLFWIKNTAFVKVFNVPLTGKEGIQLHMMWVTVDVIEWLKKQTA